MKRIIKNILKRYADRLYKYFQTKDKVKLDRNKADLRNRLASVGYNLRLNGNSHVISKPSKVIIGNNVHIGNNLFVKSEGGLVIGDNTHISRNVTIYTENHNYTGKALPYDNTTNYKPVIIKENVWIGMNVSIIPGVTIGEGAIIGIGSVVNRDVEPFEIVGTPKIQTLKSRNIEHYKDLQRAKHFGGINGEPLGKNELKKFMPTYEQNRFNNIVFILGTGRSGTVSITDLFNQHPECKAFHEDVLQLIRISTDIAHDKNKEEALTELKSIFSTKIWNASNDQLIVQSDQRLWNLVPFLSDYFPNAKFIHLVRESNSCIKSMVLRNWYADNEYPDLYQHDWAKFRVQGNLVGQIDDATWNEMTSLQKCTWYYFHINTTIKNELKKLPSDRAMTVALEHISDRLKDILEFCNLEDIGLVVNKKNQVRKKDAMNVDSDSNQTIERQISEEIEKYLNL